MSKTSTNNRYKNQTNSMGQLCYIPVNEATELYQSARWDGNFDKAVNDLYQYHKKKGDLYRNPSDLIDDPYNPENDHFERPFEGHNRFEGVTYPSYEKPKGSTYQNSTQVETQNPSKGYMNQYRKLYSSVRDSHKTGEWSQEVLDHIYDNIDDKTWMAKSSEMQYLMDADYVSERTDRKSKSIYKNNMRKAKQFIKKNS